MSNSIFRTLALFLLIAFVWQIIHYFFLSNSFFPSVFAVGQALIESFTEGDLLHHIAASLGRVAVGFAVAAISGVTLGVVGATMKSVGKIIKPLVEILRPIPPIAWIPIAILIFGLGNTSSYFIVFLGAFFPIFTSAYFGANSIPIVYKNVAGSFALNPLAYIWRVVFFYTLPAIFVGLKTGIGMAWMSVIAAELIGTQSGLGYFIEINRLLLRTDNIVAGMIAIGAIGSILVLLVSWLEKLTMPWKQ